MALWIKGATTPIVQAKLYEKKCVGSWENKFVELLQLYITIAASIHWLTEMIMKDFAL